MDGFKPTAAERELMRKARYPQVEELVALSVKGGRGQPLLLLDTAARAFEVANQEFRGQYGRVIRVNSAYRSVAEQQRLYDQLKGKQAVAVPGRSPHNYGFAIDVQEFALARPFLERVGFVWRNYFNDPWHFDFVGQ